eukprot:7345563-Prymnesium_polylepis.1
MAVPSQEMRVFSCRGNRRARAMSKETHQGPRWMRAPSGLRPRESLAPAHAWSGMLEVRFLKPTWNRLWWNELAP